METCLLNYFILNDDVRSSCDFNPFLFQGETSVYEVVRVISQKPLFIDEHINRFLQSFALAGIPAGLSMQQIKKRLKALIEINKLTSGNIRFQAVKQHPQNKAVFLAWICPWHYPSTDDYKNGVCVKSLIAERQNPNAKQDRLPARSQADKLILAHGIFEALLITKKGFVTEGSRSNVFFVDGDQIITPPRSSILPGVTRSKIIELAKLSKIKCLERPVKFSETGRFDAAFLSGTSIKVLPVNQIDSITFLAAHPLVKRVQLLYNEISIEYINRFFW